MAPPKTKKQRSGYKKKRSKVFYRPKTPATLSVSTASTSPVPSPTTDVISASVSTTPTPATPAPSDIPVPMKSKASKKIGLSREATGLSETEFYPRSSEVQDPNDVFLIPRKNLLSAVSAFSCCGSPLTITEKRAQRRGCVTKLMICCSVCGKTSDLLNPYRSEDLELNTRSVLAARMAGLGRAGLANFSGMMGMLPPLAPSHYMTCNRALLTAVQESCEENMSQAAAVLRKNAKDDELVDVKVTCDATWQRRGHQSLYGVVVVASWETGQVLDIEVLSKHCVMCSQKKAIDPSSPEFLDWWETHQDVCLANYCGSSGGMEVEGAMRIWKRSIQKHRLRYTEMIADGDSSTFPTISAALPFGEDHPVTKHECVGHVQKRMYKHLKSVKKQQHRNSAGKVIRMGGKGRLTEDLMKRLQRWYGKAIRSNPGDPVAMQRAVMATFYHSSSTDSNPHHHWCPVGSTSWCKHNRAKARNEPSPPHNTTIHVEIAPIVKKVFEDLSQPSLMERCVLGATQNQNESFNAVVWDRCPKTDFSSSVVVEIAANLAVITFNSGKEALKPVLERLHLHCGSLTESFLHGSDEVRIWQAEYRGKELVKKRRRQMRLDRVILEEEQVAAEGVQYEAGAF